MVLIYQRQEKEMKTFEEQYCAGKFYRYNIYKIVDGNWQIYYQAESVDNKGVTRLAETVVELRNMLEQDAIMLNRYYIKVR